VRRKGSLLNKEEENKITYYAAILLYCYKLEGKKQCREINKRQAITSLSRTKQATRKMEDWQQSSL